MSYTITSKATNTEHGCNIRSPAVHVSIVTRRVAVSGSWSQLWQLWCPSHAGCGCRGGESSPESRRQPEPSSDTAAAAVRPSTPSPHLLTETFSDPPSLQNTVTSETGAAMWARERMRGCSGAMTTLGLLLVLLAGAVAAEEEEWFVCTPGITNSVGGKFRVLWEWSNVLSELISHRTRYC